jgi:hypothetical protein
VPEAITNNIKNFKVKNPEYNVILLCDDNISKYYNNFTTLCNLFYLSTIAALKADIIRMIFLYEEGGIWLDSNTTLIHNNGIRILFDKCKSFDFVVTLMPYHDYDLKTSALISKPKSQLAYDSIQKMTTNLLQHFQLEQATTEYVPYNFYMFVAPVVFFELLEYGSDAEFRKDLGKIVDAQKNDVITVGLPKFQQYKSGLMIVDKYIQFYGCNMDHHHGKNVHKHWSVVQKTQRLFYSK